MSPASISVLLKLPASERAELAMALWNSLTDAERESETVLTPEQETVIAAGARPPRRDETGDLSQQTELDRRWEAHLRNPDSAIPWNDVRRRLLERCRADQITASANGPYSRFSVVFSTLAVDRIVDPKRSR